MIHKFILILAILLSSLITKSQCLKADIVLLLDWSGSESENSEYITAAAHDFIYSLNMGPSSVKVGVIPFNDIAIAPFSASISYDKSILASVVSQLSKTSPSGSTSYRGAFNLTKAFFDKSQLERKEDVMNIVILISDGEELDMSTDPIVSSIKSNGCLIWCIGTTSGGMSYDGRARLMGIASSPEFYSEQSYYTLRDELLRMNICP